MRRGCHNFYYGAKAESFSDIAVQPNPRGFRIAGHSQYARLRLGALLPIQRDSRLTRNHPPYNPILDRTLLLAGTREGSAQSLDNQVTPRTEELIRIALKVVPHSIEGQGLAVALRHTE